MRRKSDIRWSIRKATVGKVGRESEKKFHFISKSHERGEMSNASIVIYLTVTQHIRFSAWLLFFSPSFFHLSIFTFLKSFSIKEIFLHLSQQQLDVRDAIHTRVDDLSLKGRALSTLKNIHHSIRSISLSW